MRFKSPNSSSFQIFAVTGVNTISFGIKASPSARKGLLGFAVERIDPAADERYTMPGFKVFKSVIPRPNQDTQVTTWDHPIQSLVWDDFTAKANHEYEYIFHPIKGKPKNLDRSEKPVRIRVKTEPLFTKGTHDVFFNRGVASSQAYRRRFGNLPPKDLKPQKRIDEALQWLTRDLDDAIFQFIRNAKKGDTLLGCFYEFRYEPVARDIKEAIKRGVNVHLIIDGKVNEHFETDKKTGKKTKVKSFPRADNLEMLKKVGIGKKNYSLREAKPRNIQHNKFMVLLRGAKKKPIEVWTGSTNISEGGFSGQTNVGHWVRHPEIAKQYLNYWELIKTDPGARAGFDRSESIKANKALHEAVAKLHDVPTVIKKIQTGCVSVFSPRSGLDVLDLYVRLVDSGKSCSCVTLAFGINEKFKEQLLNNTSMSNIVFMLLEKQDAPNPRSKKEFVGLTAANNVYQAWGSFLDDPVYQWARETNNRKLQLNQHVAYIHSKFLLMDPLGEDPIVVTGSANFSAASTNDNDENMLIIRGDHRVADIYFTEFNRLFNHYYFRSVVESMKKRNGGTSDGSLFLAEDDKWLAKYQPGKLRTKRLNLYTGMDGAVTLRA
jgi:phosphatidylserine/phosphatidylglycerophosphate/cardiolipin synthase-like enzyme